MKVWNGYGSEHSMNLVMIGNFKGVGDAASAKEAIDRLAEQVESDVETDRLVIDGRSDHFTDGMLDLLTQLKVYSVSSTEVEQFRGSQGSRVARDRSVDRFRETGELQR